MLEFWAHRRCRKKGGILDHLEEADKMLTRLRWGHSLDTVAKDFMSTAPKSPVPSGGQRRPSTAPASLPMHITSREGLAPTTRAQSAHGQRTPAPLTIHTHDNTALVPITVSPTPHDTSAGASPAYRSPVASGTGAAARGLEVVDATQTALRATSMSPVMSPASKRGMSRSVRNELLLASLIGPIPTAAVGLSKEAKEELKEKAGKYKETVMKMEKALRAATPAMDTSESLMESRVLNAVASLSALYAMTGESPPGVYAHESKRFDPGVTIKPGVDAQVVDELPLKSPKEKETPEVIEYMEGTLLYYGSTITLQSQAHGGFLCINATEGISAAAQHPRQPDVLMKIWNLSDLTYTGAVCYGDKLCLQLGRHEILGTSPIGLRNVGDNEGLNEEEKDVMSYLRGDPSDLYFGKPVTINCRKPNFQSARYRGCWVFINKKDPLGSVGKEVQHMDEVVLEQEFAYLCSWSKEAVELRQVPSFEVFTFGQDANGPNNAEHNTRQDVYAFGRQFGWHIHLVGLPPDAIFEEERQRLAFKARSQLKWSQEERAAHAEQIEALKQFREQVNTAADIEAAHTRITRLEVLDEILKDKYAHQCFTQPYGESDEWLAQVYGPESVWASRLLLEEERRHYRRPDREQTRHDADSQAASGSLRSFGREGAGPGGRQITPLEEARVLAEAVQIESKVPIAVWSAMMAKQDRLQARNALRQIKSLHVISRAIQNFRNRRWSRHFNRIDPQLAREAVEERKKVLMRTMSSREGGTKRSADGRPPMRTTRIGGPIITTHGLTSGTRGVAMRQTQVTHADTGRPGPQSKAQSTGATSRRPTLLMSPVNDGLRDAAFTRDLLNYVSTCDEVLMKLDTIFDHDSKLGWRKPPPKPGKQSRMDFSRRRTSDGSEDLVTVLEGGKGKKKRLVGRERWAQLREQSRLALGKEPVATVKERAMHTGELGQVEAGPSVLTDAGTLTVDSYLRTCAANTSHYGHDGVDGLLRD